jgi:hypothetical protein
VCVAWVIHHAARMRRIIISCSVFGCATFLNVISKTARFKKYINENWTCVLICSTTFVWNIRHSKKNWARYQLYIGPHVKYLLLADFSGTWIFSTDFRKITPISNFVKIHPVGAKLFHADGRTGTTKLVVAFGNFVKAPQSRHAVSRGRPEWRKTVGCQGPKGLYGNRRRRGRKNKGVGPTPPPPHLVSVYEIRLYIFQARRRPLLLNAWPWCRKLSGRCVANSMITQY